MKGAISRNLAAALPTDRANQLVPMRCRMPFINASKLSALVDEYIKATPREQHEKLMRFLCTSPLDDLGAIKERKDWDAQRVPSSLKHIIRTPLEELIFQTELFLKCVNPVFFESVWDYLAKPYAPTQFDGVAVMIDQSSSTQLQQGLDPQTIKKTLSVMHNYFMAAMATFRLLKDALVGDAISLVGKAPEDNIPVAAVEAARFLLTVRTLFSIHDRLVAISPEARRSRLRIRGAMSVGRVGLSDNPIQPTAACPLMNQTSRFAGFPPEMGIVTNPEGAKYLKRFFDLTPMKVGGELLEEIRALSEKLDGLMGGKGASKPDALFEAYGLVYRRMKLNEIIHIAFERPNLPSDFIEKADGYSKRPELAKFTVYHARVREDRALLEQLRREIYANSRNAKAASERLVKIEIETNFQLEEQPYSNYTKGKFKGLTLGEMDILYSIDGYKSFANDPLATPEECRFRALFLEGEQMSAGKSRLEEFVHRTGIKYGFPVRTNYNLLAPYYLMYTMQLTGSPDFAFQSAVRALGMAIYGIEKMQNDWGRQPDVFLEQVEQSLVKRGVFNEKGEVQQEAFIDYLEKAVVLPALVNEIGILRIFDEVNKGGEPNDSQTDERGKIEAIASWLAKHFSDFKGGREEEARELIKNLGPLSARMLEELNAEFPDAIPSETIEIVRRIKFENKAENKVEPIEPSGEPLEPGLEFARNIIMASRAIQSMRKLKAHKQKQRMSELPWATIQTELQQIRLQPFVHGLYYELFLEKAG